MAKGVRETLFLGLFVFMGMGLPLGGLLWGTWWTHRKQIETAARSRPMPRWSAGP